MKYLLFKLASVLIWYCIFYLTFPCQKVRFLASGTRGLDYVSKIELQLLGCWEGRQSTAELRAPSKPVVCSSRSHPAGHRGDLSPFQPRAMARVCAWFGSLSILPQSPHFCLYTLTT